MAATIQRIAHFGQRATAGFRLIHSLQHFLGLAFSKNPLFDHGYSSLVRKIQQKYWGQVGWEGLVLGFSFLE